MGARPGEFETAHRGGGGELSAPPSPELEPRLGVRGDLAHTKDRGGKLSGAVARLAGLIHLAANLHGAVDEDPATGGLVHLIDGVSCTNDAHIGSKCRNHFCGRRDDSGR